ncbi:Na/Pi cotransporter family protein [Thiobacillus denitrificans]|uniref:Na/Pi cotransporter family protein n=1 Tax=Thiobacillus denitrificans TaxID=36861 RepID=UPI000364E2A8|nr:Na/Pi symporter [Thiobacillus denitrificans]
MLDIFFPFAGGIGLFLVGMMLLSDGLVAFAGGTVGRALVRFTGTPSKAFVSGTLVTALVQSSTATTVTLIGFVSAGLITFSQAIGVVIGASLGNTATGWIVAELGLKVNLGFYTLPLIGIGAMLKLLAPARGAALGMSLAGFGLMFLGLNTLQEGMRGLSAIASLANLPDGGYSARIVAMLIGLAMTAILQSSSAAIATTLTALHTATINFEQASALVVGASIGTTLTGALAAIGGTIYARRTALAYILFNSVAGLIAIVLLPVFLFLIDLAGKYLGLQPGATSLAAFHTLFIAAGALLFLPFTSRFGQIVERILPDRGDSMTERLDQSLLAIPAVALEASQRALEQVAQQLLDFYSDLLSPGASASRNGDLTEAGQALDRSYDFVSRIELPADDARLGAQRIAQLHAIDHLLRFHGRLHDLAQAGIDFSDPDYAWAIENSREMLALARQGLAEKNLAPGLEQLELDAVTLAALSRQVRHDLLQDMASPGASPATALRKTDAYRWMERTGHHIWRVCHYLSQGRPIDAKEPPQANPNQG